jgi:hypothetical protein
MDVAFPLGGTVVDRSYRPVMRFRFLGVAGNGLLDRLCRHPGTPLRISLRKPEPSAPSTDACSAENRRSEDEPATAAASSLMCARKFGAH